MDGRLLLTAPPAAPPPVVELRLLPPGDPVTPELKAPIEKINVVLTGEAFKEFHELWYAPKDEELNDGESVPIEPFTVLAVRVDGEAPRPCTLTVLSHDCGPSGYDIAAIAPPLPLLPEME